MCIVNRNNRSRIFIGAWLLCVTDGRQGTAVEPFRGFPLSTAGKTGTAPIPEVMIPLIAGRAEYDLVAASISAVHAEVEAQSGQKIEFLCGTMIELPRACLKADDIAGAAEFFSFGTNDLTQTR